MHGFGSAARPLNRHQLVCVAAALILLLSLLIAPAMADDAELTIERIFGSPSIYSKVPTGIRWADGGKAISFMKTINVDGASHTAFIIKAVPSGKETIVCWSDTITVPDDLKKKDSDKFRISSAYRWNERGDEFVFSYRGDLFTMNPQNGELIRRTSTESDEQDHDFSPNGKMLAYSRDHDLFTLNLETGEEHQLTTTGSDDVLNGILDWVYMEELFTRGNVKSFYWSPDSKRLAFLEIQEHPVPEFPLVDWIPVHATHKLQYYPKAGDPNPIVRVGIVRATGSDVVWADTDTTDDSYIARLYWLGDSRGVAIEKLNRAQDDLDLYFASAFNGKLEQVIEETHDTWVNTNYLKHYYKKKRQFVWGSERDGHSHLYMYNFDGSEIRQLTKGDWEVTALNGVNESKGKIYFTANEKDIRERHFYEVSEKGKMKRISKGEGTHRTVLAPDQKHLIDYFSSHRHPTKIAVYSIKGKKLFDLGDMMSDDLAAIKKAAPEFFTIEADEREYYCSMTKPLDFDPTRQYPVIVYTYGGPHAQTVRKSWSRHGLWHSMMAEKGYIIFSLDNRGSFGRGKAWEDHVLKNLGRYELVDQLHGVDYLKTLSFVDANNIGIWGWSYGGFMTLNAMFRAGDVFKAGTSVAPVSDWHLYDTIYTERYMKRPVDNPDGYAQSAPLNFAEDFDGNLLLMHGDADDNVHAQNSIKMVRKLIDAGKDFDFMIYPQKYHGISGASNRKHLYGKMTRFFDRHLKAQEQFQATP